MSRTPRPTIVVIAVVASLVVVCGLAVWVFRPQPAYHAEFIHASGLKAGDSVRVAGIEVGTVDKISLDGPRARVDFTLPPDVTMHRDATAAVKMATLLGQNYLEVGPGEGAVLSHGGTISTARTTPAYTVSDVVTQADATMSELDLSTMSKAISGLDEELDGDPATTDAALSGVTSLSRAVGAKKTQIGRLVTDLRTVTDAVNAQQGNLDDLLGDSETVFSMLQARKETLARLTRNGEAVASSLQKLVADNQKQAKPLLRDFDTILGVLDDNSKQLDTTLKMLGPQARYFANATGNGPWIDVFSPYFLFPDNALCLVLTPKECR